MLSSHWRTQRRPDPSCLHHAQNRGQLPEGQILVMDEAGGSS